MDLIILCLAFAPLNVYFIALGIINHSRQPLLTTGTRELISLCLAVCPLVFAGPIRLFYPISTYIELGTMMWFLLLGLYAAISTLIALLQAPRLIVYNMELSQFKRILVSVLEEIDSDIRWAGNSFYMPNCNFGCQINYSPILKNLTLTVVDSKKRHRDKTLSTLKFRLKSKLSTIEVNRNPIAYLWLLLGFGPVAFSLLTFLVYSDAFSSL